MLLLLYDTCSFSLEKIQKAKHVIESCILYILWQRPKGCNFGSCWALRVKIMIGLSPQDPKSGQIGLGWSGSFGCPNLLMKLFISFCLVNPTKQLLNNSILVFFMKVLSGSFDILGFHGCFHLFIVGTFKVLAMVCFKVFF